MSNYTTEIRHLINQYHIEIFDFTYPFYTDDEKVKEEFEELFINRFYFHEIGAETVDRWKQMLKARLMLKMPYYTQLYQTEWLRVNKDMMNSKDLTETTKRKLTSLDETSGTSRHTVENKQTDNQTSSSQSSGTGKADESNIADGVSLVNLNEGNKTSTSQTTTSATSSGSLKNTMTGETSGNASSLNTIESDMEEEITFHSYGDIGIQTPAYAITEWRKVIINLNEMLLNDLKDLFLQIY